jgi:excinuclease ABC subunit B
MVVRPTGLIDPETIIRPSEGQLEDLLVRLKDRAGKKERALITTLTKRTAEDLTSWLLTKGVKARYLHSDIDSLERIAILQDLRAGAFDVLVGINLLREGLDLPEVSLVAILGADHEGFLRSETTLIQISGRAARNVGGQVILYADSETGSMKRALDEMGRRRTKQLAYNAEHGIKPKTIVKAVEELEEFQSAAKREGLMLLRDAERPLSAKDLPTIVAEVEARMKAAAEALDFEQAVLLRDQLYELKGMSATKPRARRR